MPSAQEQVMERLKLCYEDIAGVNHASEYPMAGRLEPNALPFFETVAGADSAVRLASGMWQVNAEFIGIAYLATTATGNDPDEGALALKNAQPYKERVRRYFMVHPRLSTSSLAKLSFLPSALQYKSTPIGQMADGDFIGFQFTLALSWRETKDVAIS